jgi:hypothetical protein
MSLILNGAYCLLVYVDDVNLLRYNIDTIKKKNTETVTDASEDTGLEVNAEKTKYMLMSCQQNAGHIVT